MRNLPPFIKWLIVLGALCCCMGVLYLVNARASRVKMPLPDDTFGVYHLDERTA